MTSNMAKQPTLTKLERGCGFRISGGIYATASGDLTGNIPVNDFLHCPPMPIDPKEIGLAAQGVLIKEGTPYGRPGIWDVFDWIGTTHYPYLPDFIEEVRNHGFSRRIPKSAPIHLLTKDSLHIVGHPRAILTNAADFAQQAKERSSLLPCPSGHESHDSGETFDSCISYLYSAVPHKEGEPGKQWLRKFPDGAEKKNIYNVRHPHVEPIWGFGIFMTMPITAFEVIDDPMSDKAEQAMELLENSGTDIPYYLVEA